MSNVINKEEYINTKASSINIIDKVNTATSILITARNDIFSEALKSHGVSLGTAAKGVIGFVSILPSAVTAGGHLLAGEYDLAVHTTGKIVASLAGAKVGGALGGAVSRFLPNKALPIIGGAIGAVAGPWIYDHIKEHVEAKYRLDLDTPLHEVSEVVAGQVAEIYYTIIDAQQIAKQDFGMPSSLQSTPAGEFKGIPATTRGLISTEDVILLAYNLKILCIKQGYLPESLADIVKAVNDVLQANEQLCMRPTMYEYKLKAAVEKCVQESIVEFNSLVEKIENADYNDNQYDSINYENNDGPEAYTTPDNYQINIIQEHVSGQEYYLSNINTAQFTDNSWLDFHTPGELAQLQTADADGTVVPSAEAIAELRMVGEVRMAEQAANFDKTIGDANIVESTVEGSLDLPEGWEKADYEWIQAVLAGQKDGDASAAAEQANPQYQEYNSAMVSAGNSAYGIYNAALSGDGLALAQNTVSFVTSIDQAVDSYLKLEGGGDGFLTVDISGELGKIGAGLNFAGDLIELTQSIGSGDADETHDIIDYRLAA